MKPITNTVIAAGMIFLPIFTAVPAGCAAPDAVHAPVNVHAPISASASIASPTLSQTNSQTTSQPSASQPIAQDSQASAGISEQNSKATSLGSQSGGSGGWTINVGSLEIGGSTFAVLAVAATIVLLFRRGNTFKATTDVLVSKIDKLALPKLDRLDIAAKASAAGVGKALAHRVGAIRAKVAQVSTCLASKNQTLNNVNEQISTNSN